MINNKKLWIILWSIGLLTLIEIRWHFDYEVPHQPPVKWQVCALPDGERVRVNWVYTHRDGWKLSTGAKHIVGTGNLVCYEE